MVNEQQGSQNDNLSQVRPLPTGTLSTTWFPSAEQMETIELPPRQYWCNPLIPQRSKIQLTGLPKDGKGHLVELLSLCLAEGRNFLNFPCQQCRVLYLEFESTDTDLKERIELKKQSLGVRGSMLHYKTYPLPLCLDITLNEQGFDSVANLREILNDFRNRNIPINVVILDPRIKLMKGKPDNVYVPWTNNANELIRNFDISLIVVHHLGKYDYPDPSKKGLGSIKYNAWFDVLLSLKAERDNEGRITGGTLEYTGKIPESNKLTLSFDHINCIWSLAPEAERAYQTKYERAKSIILSMLGSEEQEIKRQALSDNIGHTTFHRALRDLINEERIRSIPIDRNRRRIVAPDTPL